MNFWQRLRLIGSVVVLLLSVLAIALAVLRAPDIDDEVDALPSRQQRTHTPASGTTGL
jgi:hypothetical protein